MSLKTVSCSTPGVAGWGRGWRIRQGIFRKIQPRGVSRNSFASSIRKSGLEAHCFHTCACVHACICAFACMCVCVCMRESERASVRACGPIARGPCNHGRGSARGNGVISHLGCIVWVRTIVRPVAIVKGEILLVLVPVEITAQSRTASSGERTVRRVGGEEEEVEERGGEGREGRSLRWGQPDGVAFHGYTTCAIVGLLPRCEGAASGGREGRGGVRPMRVAAAKPWVFRSRRSGGARVVVRRSLEVGSRCWSGAGAGASARAAVGQEAA
jgi:hypothetical protein